MNKEKVLNTIACVGESIVLVGVICWLAYPDIAKYIFSIGVLTMIVGRVNYVQKAIAAGSLVLRRLYMQCIFGLFVLCLSTLLMWFYSSVDGYDFGNYILRTSASSWLVPFMIFVAIELYTAFRIPAELKKEEQ